MTGTLDFAQRLSELTNSWSREVWLKRKEALADSVWITGAILPHGDADKIYVAPAPTIYAVLYEIKKSDLLEVLPSEKLARFLGAEYKLARIYLPRTAIVLKIVCLVASELPDETVVMREYAEYCEQLDAGPTSDDGSLTSASREIGPKPTPSPTPKPPKEKPGGGGVIATGTKG